MAFFVGMLIVVSLFLHANNIEGMICSIGREPDPNSNNKYRWLIPVEDPCQCTELQPGGMNTHTPCRHFNVTYYDSFLIRSDRKEIRKWLQCGQKLQGLILHRALGPMDRDVTECDTANVSSEEYEIGGNQSLVKMVPAPDVVGHACAVYAPVESYLVIGNFSGKCISDPGRCESQSVTWSIWLKINKSSVFTGTTAGYFLSSGGHTYMARGVAFLYQINMFWYDVRTENNHTTHKYNTSKIPTNEWFHLTLTVNATSGTTQLFVNGTIVASDETVNESETGSDGCTKLYIGMNNPCENTKFSPEEYGGAAAYSDLMVFDGLLNQQQIHSIYQGNFWIQN